MRRDLPTSQYLMSTLVIQSILPSASPLLALTFGVFSMYAYSYGWGPDEWNITAYTYRGFQGAPFRSLTATTFLKSFVSRKLHCIVSTITCSFGFTGMR